MALVLQDRVSVNSTGSGTGSLVLGSAYPGFRTFASCIPTGSIVYYTISNQAVGYDTEWEVGYGTYTLSTNTLSRDFVYSSSNADALVNFTAGTNGLQVFITQPADQAVYQETNGDVLIPSGILTVLGANATNPTFTGTLGEFVSNEANFSQLLTQNQNSSANASTDIVSYNNLGDGTNYFVDTGIVSSTYNDAAFPIFQANDAYLYNAGNTAGTGAAGDISRLIIGTSTANSNVVIFGGSVNVNAVIATFVASSKDVNFANNISVTSNVSANNINLTNFAYSGANLSNAANSTVLVTQAYVDGAVSTGFVVHTPARLVAATYTGTNSTYNNGSSGVGATLTATVNGALSVDGVTPSVGDRILLIAMSTAAYNGCYTVTVVGDGSTPWQLTRATDFDTAAPGEIANNAYFFITSGTSYAGFSYVLSQLTSPIVVGTTALPFAEFAQALVYTGTAPINVSGQTISLTGVVPVANGGTNLSSYTAGDTVYASAANVLSKRAIGAANTVLVSNGSVPDWGTVALGSASAVSGTLGATNGGTGQSTYTLGDIIYSDATNTLAKLAGQTTTTKKFLSQTGTGAASAAPVWDTIPAGSITGTLPLANGGTASTTAPQANATLRGWTTTATAAGTTTLTNASSFQQEFTGTTTQTVVLPVTSTLALGWSFEIINNSTGSLTVNSSGGNLVGTVIAGTTASIVCSLTTGTTAASWDFGYTTFSTATGSGSVVLSSSPGINGAMTFVGSAAQNSVFGSAITSGTIGIGGTAGTGTITVGQSTVSQTTNIQAGATASGSTKTMNIGTGGLTGSTTAITIGSANSTTITLNGNVSGSNIVATTATNIAGGAAGSIPYQTGSGATSLLATGSGVLVGGTTPSYSSSPTLTGTNFTSIPNGATTATAANTASAIVARDASGNFTAGTITANLTGTASSATSATNTTNVAIINDVATAVSVYPVWSNGTSGNQGLETSSTALSFVPSTGVLTATVHAGSGAQLTNLNASNVASGTIPSAILGNSSVFIGTTSTALNRASANQALTGISSTTFPGATSGTVQLIPAAVAGTGTVLTMPATTGTVVTTGDSATVTNTMLAGSIANAKLANSSTTINGTAIALGASGTVTAANPNAVTFNNGGAGGASGSTYTGASTLTVSYNTVGAPSTGGTGASGTWGISISGSAASATTATNQSGGTVTATTGSFSGTITSSVGGNAISFTNATSNWILWPAFGVAAPTFTTRSVGTKLVLYPDLGASAADYALGIESNTLWSSVPNTSSQFKWYGGTTTAATLTGAGALTLVSSCTATSFIASSDERLKTNWAGLDLDFVSKLANIKSGTFERLSDGSRDVGVSAQALQKLVSEAVVEGADGMLAVNYGGAALVAAVELAKVVEELRAEVKELKAKLANGA